MPPESDSGAEWKLRLFFSVDLIGSSSYKAKKSEKKEDPEWCVAFENFYEGFPDTLKKQYENSPKCLHISKELSTSIWKISGDEILFHTEIPDYKQVVAHLIALKSALIEYNTLLDRKSDPSLRCKGTAWIAGFPVNNIEVKTKLQSGTYTDFIGPSIDAGFRLAQYSTKRKLILSVDTLLILSQAMMDIESDGHSFNRSDGLIIRFDGKFELKGVYNNTPYPVFWIDVRKNNEDIFSKEDEWLGKGEECKYKEVFAYCKNYLQKENEYMIEPFIAGGSSKRFNSIPEGMEKKREKALNERKIYKDRFKQREKDSSDKSKKIKNLNVPKSIK